MPASPTVNSLDFGSLPSVKALGKELYGSTWARDESSALIFVCGGNHANSLREQYLKYASIHHAEYGFFRAEAILEGLEENADLLTLEDQLADYSDCLMIFCESQSAFAELGAFSLKAGLSEKLLVINDRNFQTAKSFINLGPLAKVKKESQFGGTVWIEPNDLLFHVDNISKRLNFIGQGRRHSITTNFPNGLEVGGDEKRNRMMLILDVLRACAPLTRKELILALHGIHIGKLPDLAMDINFLLSLNLAKNVNGFLVPTHYRNGFSYQSHRKQLEIIRAKTIRYIFQQDPDRLKNASQ